MQKKARINATNRTLQNKVLKKISLLASSVLKYEADSGVPSTIGHCQFRPHHHIAGFHSSYQNKDCAFLHLAGFKKYVQQTSKRTDYRSHEYATCIVACHNYRLPELTDFYQIQNVGQAQGQKSVEWTRQESIHHDTMYT
jgi:hypothetical protein